MKFRPCIDIHNGKVKQLVGEALRIKEIRQMKILYQKKMQPIMLTFTKKMG